MHTSGGAGLDQISLASVCDPLEYDIGLRPVQQSLNAVIPWDRLVFGVTVVERVISFHQTHYFRPHRLSGRLNHARDMPVVNADDTDSHARYLSCWLDLHELIAARLEWQLHGG
jgi:hypothetical protein